MQDKGLWVGTDPAIHVGMNTLILMVGGSGSGKSTVRAERFATIPVVDCDEIKAEHPDYDPKNPAGVHDWSSREATRRLMGYVSRGESVVFDSTGTNLDKLAQFAGIARSAGMQVVAVYVTCDVETAIQRDAARPRTVGAAMVRERHAAVATAWPVLRTMVDKFELVVND